jgi:hypothetical protein
LRGIYPSGWQRIVYDETFFTSQISPSFDSSLCYATAPTTCPSFATVAAARDAAESAAASFGGSLQLSMPQPTPETGEWEVVSPAALRDLLSVDFGAGLVPPAGLDQFLAGDTAAVRNWNDYWGRERYYLSGGINWTLPHNKYDGYSYTRSWSVSGTQWQEGRSLLAVDYRDGAPVLAYLEADPARRKTGGYSGSNDFDSRELEEDSPARYEYPRAFGLTAPSYFGSFGRRLVIGGEVVASWDHPDPYDAMKMTGYASLVDLRYLAWAEWARPELTSNATLDLHAVVEGRAINHRIIDGPSFGVGYGAAPLTAPDCLRVSPQGHALIADYRWPSQWAEEPDIALAIYPADGSPPIDETKILAAVGLDPASGGYLQPVRPAGEI